MARALAQSIDLAHYYLLSAVEGLSWEVQHTTGLQIKAGPPLIIL